jgi:hypothetical protein
MKLKHLIIAISIALLPLAASAATFIIPAAGTGPGVNDSHWQSELTLHNTSASAVTAGLRFHDGGGAKESDTVTVNARSTVTIADVVRTRFGRESATGAIEITVPDAAANKLAINSRTFNTSSAGEFGQDIPAVNAGDAANAGDVVVLQAPSSVADYRFNFGIYAVTDTTVRWDLVRADGSVTTPLSEQNYAAGMQLQFNRGVEILLGATAQNNDTIHAVVTKGKMLAYGSSINNASGDPTFVPGIRARADIRLNFAGVDLDENGTVDVADADHDGVLDQPIDVFTSMYPNYFRVVVEGQATLELVDAPRDVALIDANTVQWAPGGDLKGKSGALRIRATVNGISEILTIPANFR